MEAALFLAPPFQAAGPARKQIRSQDWIPHSDPLELSKIKTGRTPAGE
jgi:hypothetical protein